MTPTLRELMTRIRVWIRKLAVALYDLGATQEEDQFWWLEKKAADAEFFHKRYRSVLEELEDLEQALAEPPAPKPVAKSVAKPAAKKRAPRRKG